MKDDYLKDEVKATIAQKHQLFKTNEKISEIDSILLNIESEQKKSSDELDVMINHMENLLEGHNTLINKQAVEENIFSITKELNNVNISIKEIEQLDSIYYSEDNEWNSYMTQIESYADRNDLDLDLEFQKMFAFENIDLLQINEGIEPSIICVDGFLTENESGSDWLINMPDDLKRHSIYYLKWESQSFLKMVQEIFFPSIEKLFRKIAGPLIIKDVLKVWSAATSNAEKAGKSLASLLYNQEKSFILFGHSLGSRVISYCLENLNKTHKCNIIDVFLLGGAVGNDYALWSNKNEIVDGCIYNFLSKKDRVLQILYKIGEASKLEFNSPVGRDPISIEFIQDIDVSQIINGHTVYHDKFRDLYLEYLSHKQKIK